MRCWLMALLLTMQNWVAAELPPTILILGDSLSAGYGMNVKQGWVSLLEERLKEKNIQVVNASISGETTAGGRSRLPKLLEQHRPTWVLIELGANDGMRGLSLKSMQENIEQLVQLSQQNKAIPILIGMKLPENYGSAFVGKFYDIYQNVAKKYQLTLVPFLLEGIALNPNFFQNDGVHPTSAAQPYLLENVWQHLQSLLQKP
jgi:acyl-CoA thioesterase I